MPIITTALALAQFVPGLAKLLGGDKAEAVASKVVGAANALAGTEDPKQTLDYIQANPELQLQLQQQMNDFVIEQYQAENVRLETVNKTIRVEALSLDWFVRRWRPFYGYAVATSWAIQMMGFTFVFVYIAIESPDQLATTVQQFALLSGSLITLWGIALAVLGVSVNKRTQDKQMAAGHAPEVGILGAVAKRILNKEKITNG
jgi:roadblock/LC7 domain-containing protein